MPGTPFSRRGTSEYPVSSPFIGQTHIYNHLREFLSEDHNAPIGNFIVYGDWGTGKSRVGHQLIAEGTDGEHGWLVQDGSGNYAEKHIFEELEKGILPLWVRLSEFEDNLTTRNAAAKAVNAALESVAEADSDLYADIAERFESAGGSLFDLEDIAANPGQPTELLERYLDVIVGDSEIDRLLVIIDEVEEAGSIGDQAPDSEQTTGTGRQTLQALFEGLKEATNDVGGRYPANFHADFVLLCTSGVERYSAPTGGVERRIEDESLHDPTIRDAKEYVRRLLENTETEIQISPEAVEALFFASFNNFGWFTRAMSTLCHFKQQSPNQPYYEIIKSNPDRFDDIFDPQYVDDILGESDEIDVVDQIVDIIYRIHPVDVNELGLSPSEVDPVLDYTTPLEDIRPIGELVPVKTSISSIKRKLGEAGFEVTPAETSEQVVTYSGTRLKTGRLEDLLTVFRIDDDHIGFYGQREDLRGLAEFAFEAGQVDDAAIEALVDALETTRDDNAIGDGRHLAPTLQFLAEWNIRWRKYTQAVRWLDDEELWDELMEAARNATNEAERVAKGFIYTRFRHYDGPSPPPLEPHEERLPATNFVTDISGDNTVDVVRNNSAVVLHHDDTTETKNSIHRIKRAATQGLPIIYLLFETEAQRQEVMVEIRDEYEATSSFIIPQVISNRDLARDFFIQFSFLGQGEEDIFTSDDLRGNLQYIEENRQQPVIERDQEWFEVQKEDGRVLREVVPPSATTRQKEALAEGLLLAADGQNLDQEHIDPWHRCWENSDRVSPLFNEDRQLQLPNFIPHVLGILDQQGPLQNTVLAGQLLCDSEIQIETVASNTLELLSYLGLVSEGDDGYQFHDTDYLDTRIEEVSIKVPSSTDDAFEDFEVQPTDQTLFDLRINDSKLNSYRNDLDTYPDQLRALDHEILLDAETNPGDWYDTTSTVHEIIYFANRGYDPNNTFDSLEEYSYQDIGDEYADMREDMDHEDFSIAYRFDFLEEFDDVLAEDRNQVLDLVGTCQEKLENQYDECQGNDFPTSEITNILADIKEDLELEADIVDDALLQADQDEQGTGNTIKHHLNNQEFEEAFTRIGWYNGVLQGRVPGPWKDFTDAHNEFETFLDAFDELEDDWGETEEFFSGVTQFENFLSSQSVPLFETLDQVPDVTGLITEDTTMSNAYDDYAELEDITPSAELDVLERVEEDPEDSLGDSAPSVLLDSIKELRRKIASLNLHQSVAREIADQKIEQNLQKLEEEWAPLENLATAVSEEIEIDRSPIDGPTPFEDKTYREISELIGDIRDQIDDEGERLLNTVDDHGDRYWESYLTAYNAAQNNKPLSDSEIDPNHLEKLAGWDIIQYKEQYHVSR